MKATAILLLLVAIFLILNASNLQKVFKGEANFSFNAKPDKNSQPVSIEFGQYEGKG